MPKFLEVTDTHAAKAAINADFYVNALDFGVIGDGTTDVTDEIQDWITYVVTNKRQGWLPRGTYKISNTLVVPTGYCWGIVGESNQQTVILQAASNIPIMKIGTHVGAESLGVGSQEYMLRDFSLKYATPQPATNTNANCLTFEGARPGSGIDPSVTFHAVFDGLFFQNGYYGFKSGNNGYEYGLWGCTFDRLGMLGMSGGLFDDTGSTGGNPNNVWGRMTLDCAGAQGPIFKGLRGSNNTVQALEFLNADQEPVLFQTDSGFYGQIGSMKVEQAIYSRGGAIYQFLGNHQIQVGTIAVEGLTAAFEAPAGEILSIVSFGGGTEPPGDSRLEIGSIVANASSLTGECVAINGGNAPNVRASVGETTLKGGWTFQSTGASITSRYVRNEAWINGGVSPALPDADYTIAVGDFNTLNFTTAFTAQRTITLPSRVTNNACAGLYYDLVFDGAINGSNTAIIKERTNQVRVQTADKIKLRYMWQRDDSSGNWILTDVVSLAPSTRSIATVTASGTTIDADTNTDYVRFCNVSSADTNADKLVSLIHFDGSNNSTTVTDSALSGPTWTANGNAKLSTLVKKFGTASLALDGSGDYLSTTSSSKFNFSGSAFCVEGWFYPANTGAGLRGIFGQRIDNDIPTWWLFQTGAAVEFMVGNAALSGWNSDTTSGSVLSANTWHHIAVAGDGSTVKVFVNGTQVVSVSQPSWTSADRQLVIGSGASPGSGYQFNGYVDEIRVTKGAARYTGAFTAPTAAFPDQNIITLPTAAGNGNRYTIKNVAAAPVFVTTTSSQTINGSASYTLTNESTLSVLSYSSNWQSV